MKLDMITLFKNGVGLFEGEADVKNHRFSMEFKKEQMPDVLKTVQVASTKGNAVPFSVFDTSKTLEKTLGEIGISIPEDRSLSGLIKQSIGYEMSLRLKSGKRLEGVVMGMDVKVSTSNKGGWMTEPTVVMRLKDGSVKSVPVGDVLNFEVGDEDRDIELMRFLDEMKKHKKKEIKSLEFVFAKSKSPKKVRVSYMAEIPVWKVSYRLNMKGRKARISCWAIIENGTGQDWEDAQLSLASGRPISFQYDIYSTRYAHRPTMQIAEENTLLPAEFQETVPRRDLTMERGYELDEGYEEADMKPSAMRSAPRDAAQTMVSRREFEKLPREPEVIKGDAAFSEDISVSSSEVEDTTIYTIAGKVNVPKGKSLSIPLFSKDVKVSKVSVYNANNHYEHPMHVVELTNDTKAAWQTGPIVTFESGTYVGESMLKNIKVGETKKLSYALDTDIFVSNLGGSTKSTISRVLCEKGVIYFEYHNEEFNEYAIKNKGDSKKKVIIEHPKNYDAVSISPKPSEETADYYRFEVGADAEKTKKLKFRIVTSQSNSVALINNPNLASNLSWYFKNKWLKGKEANLIKELIREQKKINEFRAELTEKEKERKRLSDDLQRARDNYNLYAYNESATSSAESAEKERLRAKYRKKISAIDREIDAINDGIEKLQKSIRDSEKSFADRVSKSRFVKKFKKGILS